MQLTLVVPDLLAAARGAPERATALARLGRYAPAPAAVPEGLDAAVIFAAGGTRDMPAAPFAALGAGFDPGTAYVLRADPVAFVAGRDDVLIEGRVDDLADSEAASMIATLNRHFADDGLAFHAPRADAWFVTVAGPARPRTTPLAMVRGAIHPHLPQGDHARPWRRWLSEMQMLLHEHPANAARTAQGNPPVTGIWVAEGGVLARPHRDSARELRVCAAAGRAGDVARGAARAAGRAPTAPPADFTALPANEDALVVLPSLASASDLQRLGDTWLAPAVAALEGGALSRLTLLADTRGAAWAWTAVAPSFALRLRARWSPRPFVTPEQDATA
jgi:hypothetical protein